ARQLRFRMHTTPDPQILKTLAALRTNLLTLVALTDKLTDLIEHQPEAPGPPKRQPDEAGMTLLSIDRAHYAVRWRDQSCILGCSTGFRLLERLAKRPSEYISTDQLLE